MDPAEFWAQIFAKLSNKDGSVDIILANGKILSDIYDAKFRSIHSDEVILFSGCPSEGQEDTEIVRYNQIREIR
jgi:hypothetical protein